MARFLTALAGLATLAAVLPGAPVPRHLMPKNPPYPFPTRVGTTWVYETPGGERTLAITDVKEQDGGVLVTTEMLHDAGKRSLYTVQLITPTGVYRVAEYGGAYEKPWLYLKFPARDGDSWRTKILNQGPGDVGTMTAGPTKKVKVAAGEFTAMRVEWKDRHGKEFNMPPEVHWYAPGVGLVRLDGHMELKEFRPVKD